MAKKTIAQRLKTKVENKTMNNLANQFIFGGKNKKKPSLGALVALGLSALLENK